MCGFGDKPCATCMCGTGCVASMREDLYVPASMETVISRLDNHEYEKDRTVMKTFLIQRYLYDYNKRSFIS